MPLPKKIGFVSVSGRKTLIFRHVFVFLDDTLQPPGHRAAEVAQVLSADVLGPHLQDSLLQLRDRGDVLAFVFVFQKVPVILYRVQVQQIGPWGSLQSEVWQWAHLARSACCSESPRREGGGPWALSDNALCSLSRLVEGKRSLMSTGSSKGCPHHQAGWVVLTVYQKSYTSDPAGLLTLFLVALKQQNVDLLLYITLLQSFIV